MTDPVGTLEVGKFAEVFVVVAAVVLPHTRALRDARTVMKG